MIDFSPSEVAAYYRDRLPTLKQTTANYWRGPCPVHQGKNDNFAVEASTGLAKCHSECGKGWDILGLEMELSGRDFPTSKREVFGLLGRQEPPYADWDILAAYDYTNKEGKLLYQVTRRHPKKFGQRRPNGRGGWIASLGGMERVPFQLPLVLKSKDLAIVEGEKDALTLTRNGIPATCNSEGAGKWRPELSQYFAGKRVIIIPDNDQAGRDHALKVAESLHGTASRIQIVELPNMPEKADVSDFLGSGKTIADLKKLIAESQDYTPDFQFATVVPHEEDKWVQTAVQVVRESGTYEKFWDLTARNALHTPFHELTDDLNGGLRDEEVYILAAPTGMGKTSLALQFMSKWSRANLGGLLFSLEMNKTAVMQRLVSLEERVDLSQLRVLQYQRNNGAISHRDEAILKALMAKLIRGTKRVERYPLLVHQRPAVTTKYVIEEVKRLSERQKISYLCIDHAQLMGSSGNEKEDYQKFTAISRALKGQVARELKIPILLISQISRSAGMDKRTELEVRDLRGSGALEEDSAAIMLLYHDAEHVSQLKAQNSLGKGPVKTWLKIGKNRFGQSGTYLELMHWKGFTRFESLDNRDWEPELPIQPELGAA